MEEVKQQITRTTLFAGGTALMILVVWVVYRQFGTQLAEMFALVRTGDEEAMAAYLNSQSQWGGYLALYLICILQVVSIFFPGMVIQIAGALIYGWWRSFLICWIGFVSGNALVFAAAKVFGKSFTMLLQNEKKKDNWLMTKINEGNPMFVVGLACLVPGVPNGIIPYIAAHARMNLKQYALAVACSSWVQISLNCIAGHFLRNGDYLFMILAFAFQIGLIVVIARNRDKILKPKQA